MKIWPQYILDNSSKWPKFKTFNPNILQGLYCEKWQMARGLLSSAFLLSQVLTLPLFKLLELVGFTLTLCCYNLKSSVQQQLFPDSLSCPEWRLESSSPTPAVSLLFHHSPNLSFLWQIHQRPPFMLDFHPTLYYPATLLLKTSSSDFNPAVCHPFLFSHFTRYK
jgi:hypothetical protein